MFSYRRSHLSGLSRFLYKEATRLGKERYLQLSAAEDKYDADYSTPLIQDYILVIVTIRRLSIYCSDLKFIVINSGAF